MCGGTIMSMYLIGVLHGVTIVFLIRMWLAVGEDE